MNKNSKSKISKHEVVKVCRIMKLTLFFFILGIGVSFASDSYSQSKLITLKLTNATMKEALREIEKQSEYIFFYQDDALDTKKNVSVDLKNKTINEVLNELLKTTGDKYKVSDRQVYISKTIKDIQSEKQIPQKKIKGVVKDEKGEPLAGVVVTLKGSTTGTATAGDGSYEILIPEQTKNPILVFKYISYDNQEVVIDNKTEIGVVLKEVSQELSEYVLVGFGKQKKESVVGAIQAVNAEDLRIPAANLSSSFAGRIAGVIAVQKSGEPGADGANFWIRGLATFGSNQSPLYVLDGVEVSLSEINSLPPEVIENFSVLKDASATALYGAKGSNGVIMVTTKTGAVGEKARVNVRFETSASQPTRIPEVSDGITYMKLYNEAVRTRLTPGSSYIPQYRDDKIAGTMRGDNPLIYPNTDWYSTIFKDVAWNQNLNVNVSGGTKVMSYFLNAGIRHDQGLFKSYEMNSIKTNLDNMRYTFQTNLSSNVSSTTRVGLKINAILEDRNRPKISTSDIFARTLDTNPVEFPAIYPARAGYDVPLFGNNDNGPGISGLAGAYPNPYADLVSGQSSITGTSVLAIFDLEQKLDFIVSGLKIKGVASFNNYNSSTVLKSYGVSYFKIKDNTLTQNPDGSYKYDLQTLGLLSTSDINNSPSSYGNKTINMQAILDYDKTFGDHSVSAALIYLQRAYSEATGKLSYLHEKNQGVSGRATYNFASKYLAEFNFGYNGSSNFPKGKRFGFFPAVAVGYYISNESYYEPLKNIVNTLKVRASYGLVGGSFTNPAYPYLTEVVVGQDSRLYKWGYDWSQAYKGYTIYKYGNPDATWESARKFDVGLEFSVLNNKLHFIGDYFSEVRDNIFMQRKSVPASIGITGNLPWSNIGAAKNKGVDFTVEYKNQFNKDLYISARTSFTYAKNEITALDEAYNTPKYASLIGKSINSMWALLADGLLTEADFNDGVDRFGFSNNILPGDIKYVDQNNDNAISALDFGYLNKTETPQIIYGFGGSAQYKKFDFSFLFQGAAKTHLRMDNIHPFGANRKSVLKYVAENHWSENNPNPNALYPRLSNGTLDNNTRHSSFWIKDASYLRLKQVELGYSYRKLRAYLSGTNLLTFSPFKHWDPEVGSGNGLSYPPQRVVNLGLQFNF